MSKVLFIIAPEMFRDEEYFQPKEILESGGHSVTTASAVTGACRGKFGGTAMADMLLKDADPSAYDAVAFIGGGGAVRYIEDGSALALARDAYARGKLVAAICVAPLILAASGILKDKKATVFESDAEDLKKSGAVYTGRAVEIDGRIITAAGPFAAKQFGEALAAALKQ